MIQKQQPLRGFFPLLPLGGGILTLFAVLVVIGCASAPTPPEALAFEDERLTDAFARLDRLTHRRGESAQAVRAVYLPLREALASGRITLDTDPVEDGGFVDGVLFVGDAPEEGKDSAGGVLRISPSVLEVYNEYPSILLSSLVMESREAASFIRDPQEYSSTGGSSLAMERALLESRRLQARFIGEILKPAGYALLPFETFLDKSRRENDMAVYMSLLRGVELERMNSMAQALAVIKEGDAESLLEVNTRLVEEAKELRQNFAYVPGADTMKNYQALIPGATFLTFIQEIQMETWQAIKPMGEEEKAPIREQYQQLDMEINQLSRLVFERMDLYVDSFRSVIDHYSRALPESKDGAGRDA